MRQEGESSGIDWSVAREAGGQSPRQYNRHTCPECGKTISEGAFSGRTGNLKKHMEAHERRRSTTGGTP